jgi:microsomal prostaglandin-E synthase 2
MNTISALIPVGGSLSRMKMSSRWPSSLVIGEKFRFCISHCPPSRGIATNDHNQNLVRIPKKGKLQLRKNDLSARVAVTRNQSSSQTTTTVSDHNNEGDDIHRYRYQLYKYKICPFSNIAKVFLEYQKIPFESVEVNPLTKVELGFSEKYRKVPIVTILDSASTTPAAKAFQQLNGTEEILPHDYQLSENGIIDDDDDGDEFVSSDSSIRWQDFARNKLAPLLYPNICRTLGDSFRAFDYVHSGTNSFSAVQRYSIQYVGSVAMYFAASKIKEKYKIDDVQVALEETLAELESELSKEGSKFLRHSSSSELPHLGDLSVFGVLKGLKGLPLWNEIFNDDNSQPNFPNIRRWYADVDNAVETRKLQTHRYGFNH